VIDRLVASLELVRGGVHLGDLSAVLARRHTDRLAVDAGTVLAGFGGGPTWTFAQLEDTVGRLAAAHVARGVEAGDVVMLVLANRIDVLLHTLALARAGAIPALASARLTAGELASIASATRAAMVVADPDAAIDRLDIAVVVTSGAEDALAPVADGGTLGPAGGDPSATALLLTTSGTTGTPKAAALTSRGLVSAIGRLALLPVGGRIGLRGGRDMILAALPLTHVMGFSLALSALTAGIPLLHRERFRADEALDLIETRQPNVFVGVPTMYADLEAAGAADRDLSSVQLWLSAADVMPPDRARRFQEFGAAARVAGRGFGTAAFADVYGMVELSGPAAVRLYPPSPSERLALPPVSVAFPGVELRAVDDEGEPVAWGTVGELEVRGAGVLQHYEGQDDPPARDGWFATGDIARVWPGGLFALVGRGRDRLKVSGFSVFPAEIEAELREHPHIREVAVVGVPDDRRGERPVALVVPDDDFDAAEFLAWAAERVAGYRRPTDVVTTDALPLGPHGKIDRAAATEVTVQRLGERVEEADRG